MPQLAIYLASFEAGIAAKNEPENNCIQTIRNRLQYENSSMHLYRALQLEPLATPSY